jgi:transcriptional regulator with XRE-family HTH domain
MTQAELSKRLGMSQGLFSVVERGEGSFSAEQFVEILRVFNVTVGDLVGETEAAGAEASLQSALSRLGAAHLAEDARVLPSDQLTEVEAVLREVLIAGDLPRQITALAPVLILNVERLNLTKLWVEFQGYGLERRLAWVIDSSLEAVRAVLASLPGLSRKAAIPLKKAELAFDLFLRREGPKRISRDPGPPPDPAKEWTIDVDLIGGEVSEKTLREIVLGSSDVARRWGVATTIQTEDFVEAVRAAGVTVTH